MQVTKSSTYDSAGSLQKFFGFAFRDPSSTDGNGDRFYESNAWARLLRLPKSQIRVKGGTISYDLTTTQDPDILYFFNTLGPSHSQNVPVDVTWGPQFDDDGSLSPDDWDFANLGRLTYCNEPPNHTPSIFADGQDYTDRAIAFYDSLSPRLKAKFYWQGGKPEFVEDTTGNVGQNTKDIHNSYLTATQAAVAAGDIPPNIYTTHKYNPYSSDMLQFYDDLMSSYRTRFTSAVKVYFGEYKFNDQIDITIDNLLQAAEGYLCLMRLNTKYPNNIDGMSYQQGAMKAGHSPIGVASGDPSEPWQNTLMMDWFEMMAYKLFMAQQMDYQVTAKPDDVQLIICKRCFRHMAAWVNKGETDVEVNLDGKTMEFIDTDLTYKQGQFSGVLPARSTGIMKLSRNVTK
jgi:hypothetical protein